MTATAHEPSARHSKRRHATPRGGLLAFLVLALVAAGTGFLFRAPAEPPAAASEPGAAVEPAAYLLRAEATAEARAARFRISTTRSPAAAVLALDPAGTSPARTLEVDLSSETTEVVVRGLAVGKATWTLTSSGAPTLRGKLRIPATTGSGASPDHASATPVSSPAAPGAGSEPGSRGDSVGSPSRPRPAPTPPAPQPEPQPAPSEPSAPQPTPTPRPTGPASPYDPDDD